MANVTRTECVDRLSGESFVVAGDDVESEIREYLAEALNPGETVAYEVTADTGEFFSGEVTG